jgi:hypothetical protein
MNESSHLIQQIAEALTHVPATECGRLLAYALAIKYNLATSKGEDYGTAREIAMILFQVSDEDLFQVVAEAYALAVNNPDDGGYDHNSYDHDGYE